ncbi:MAG: DNA helicase RecG [Bacillota bacterium]|nr:MAG: DNA helicase RecG [Bacillota bacterium]
MELTRIKGISEKRESEFAKLGVYRVEDLPALFPRAYLDLRRTTLLKECYHNDVVLTVGKVTNVPSSPVSARRVKYVKAYCSQYGEPFTAIWFNQPYVLGKLKEDAEYLFYGRVQNKFGQVSLINPSFEPIDANFNLKGIVPQYPLKGALSQKIVRESVKLALLLSPPRSIIPLSLQKKYQLPDLAQSYCHVHAPESFTQKSAAADRIAAEEYFALISAFKLVKGSSEQVRINRYSCGGAELSAFIDRFPFRFTEGQKAAVKEIFADMKGEKVMNRLVQGDVGSGKTAVGLSAMYVALKSGYQAVMLAPTEVLARQNCALAKRYFPEYRVELLVGSNRAKEKREIKARLKSGEIDVLVGTHAVLQSDVEFARLSFCLCDEQHRFGVAQRSALSAKGICPDVLVMSATPIPRTLSLIFYGDLDISTIADKPAERKAVRTNIVPYAKYDDMLQFIAKHVAAGRQAYFVCPKIEEDEEGSLMSVKELYEELEFKLPRVKFCLLHGKMKDAEKTEIMRAFKAGEYDAIVSTTVIEVGVDVPNASIMVIYNAERFGLSQLHQLRGRVGRSDLESFCFLLTQSAGDSLERLKILKNNADGFKIAEYDYEMRGGGDFLGARQSGKAISDLGYLSYSSASIFLAKKLSDEAFLSGENLDEIKRVAAEKYEKLKDVALN